MSDTLTLYDMVHQFQKILALAYEPTVYAMSSMWAALRQISDDSG
jgi:hypothetical protein